MRGLNGFFFGANAVLAGVNAGFHNWGIAATCAAVSLLCGYAAFRRED